jgi:hypothetical protein
VVLALLAAVLGVGGCTGDVGGGASVVGDAFSTEVSPLTGTTPAPEGAFVAFGSVALRNMTSGPITLVDAALVYTDNVTASNFGIGPYGPNIPIARVNGHVEGTAPLSGFVIPSGKHDERALYGITFEATVDPGHDSGLIVGMDVAYLDGGEERTQRFVFSNMICRDRGVPCPTTYEGREVFNADTAELLEDLLAAGAGEP